MLVLLFNNDNAQRPLLSTLPNFKLAAPLGPHNLLIHTHPSACPCPPRILLRTNTAVACSEAKTYIAWRGYTFRIAPSRVFRPAVSCAAGEDVEQSTRRLNLIHTRTHPTCN
jgi:hypothetical protein